MHPKLRRYVEPPPRTWPLFALAFGFGLTALAGAMALENDSRMHCFSEDRVSIARAAVEKYAEAAYPQWVAAHPGRPLTSLLPLNEYMNNKDAIDPWHSPYLLVHRGSLIIVGSTGPDQKLGTSDDIWSSQP